MANDRSQWAEKLDRIAHTNRVRIGLSLLVCAFVAATVSVEVSFAFFLVLLILFVFLRGISAVLWITAGLYPKQLSEPAREQLQEAVAAITFFGILALVGTVLRGDNLVSEAVATHLPGGVTLTFIHPIFAVILIIGIWAYTVMGLLISSDNEQGGQG